MHVFFTLNAYVRKKKNNDKKIVVLSMQMSNFDFGGH